MRHHIPTVLPPQNLNGGIFDVILITPSLKQWRKQFVPCVFSIIGLLLLPRNFREPCQNLLHDATTSDHKPGPSKFKSGERHENLNYPRERALLSGFRSFLWGRRPAGSPQRAASSPRPASWFRESTTYKSQVKSGWIHPECWTLA